MGICNKLRGSVESSEYKHVVLGLIFLKFASDKFEEHRKKLLSEGKKKYIEMPDFYNMNNVFFLDEVSRWSYIIKNSKQNDIALKIDTALHNIEKNNGVNNKAGSFFAPYEFFYAWRRVSGLAKDVDGIDSIYTLIQGMFNKNRLRDIIRNFIYFPDSSKKNEKIVCRYPQYYAAKRLYDNIKSAQKPKGDGKGGTYFGATGSGKSFTMLYLTRLLMKSEFFASPTIVLITDRIDLDNQLSEQFANAKRFNNSQNMGCYKSFNNGYRVAKGKYLAMIGHDDIAYSNRLEKQLRFMEQNEDVGIAGSCVRFGSPQNIFYETNSDILKVSFLNNNFINHPSTIMRSKLLKIHGLVYDENLWFAADYDLLVRGAKYFRIVNVNEILMQYRWSTNQMTASWFKYLHEIEHVRLKQILNFGIEPTDEEMQIHLNLMNLSSTYIEAKSYTLKWVKKLIYANKKRKYYHQTYLEDFLFAMLYRKSARCDNISNLRF